MLQRQLFARSERVKGIDFHPTEPWVSFYNPLNFFSRTNHFLDFDNLVQRYVETQRDSLRDVNALITCRSRSCLYLVL
jgi:hypothetical protein